MTFDLKLPRIREDQGWKVKVRDKERVEPPPVTIMRKARCWRWGLRSERFPDREPDPREAPEELLQVVRDSIDLLGRNRDRMYPDDPVTSEPEPEARGSTGGRKPETKSRHKCAQKLCWSNHRDRHMSSLRA